MAHFSSFCYLFLALSPSVLAAPVSSVASQLSAANGNLTLLRTDITPAWAAAANYRGTSDILWSCLLTLTACIYNAIHLNVPRGHETKLRRLGRKIAWVATALFAPEIVLFAAYSQYEEARKLVEVLNAHRFSFRKDGGREEQDRDDLIAKKDLDVVAGPGVVKPIGTSDCIQEVKVPVPGEAADEITTQKGTALTDTKHPTKVIH